LNPTYIFAANDTFCIFNYGGNKDIYKLYNVDSNDVNIFT